jgi:hypothetical protein
MADYYPPIAQAVNSLQQSTAETRRAIYDRARAVMVAQLRSLTPPYSESAIRREQRLLKRRSEKPKRRACVVCVLRRTDRAGSRIRRPGRSERRVTNKRR